MDEDSGTGAAGAAGESGDGLTPVIPVEASPSFIERFGHLQTLMLDEMAQWSFFEWLSALAAFLAIIVTLFGILVGILHAFRWVLRLLKRRRQLRTEQTAAPSAQTQPVAEPVTPAPPIIDYARIPGAAEGALIGRDDTLAELDRRWADDTTRIVALVAEGGAGKSALANAWLVRQQQTGFGGAEAVLGWSFYSQGSKQRTTSAEPFFTWALDRLGLTAQADKSFSEKARRLAQAVATRRILLVLDGVEPLQEPPGPRFGNLRDPGLVELLRGMATQPPAADRGMILVTTRAPLTDLQRWADTSVWDKPLENLSPEAAADLLRAGLMRGAPNGTPEPRRDELRAASEAFAGHALSLTLLGSYLRDVHGRRIEQWRDIRDLTTAAEAAEETPEEAPGAGHARRVLTSYDQEWLRHRPAARAVMLMVGLFDRPADGDCLKALLAQPVIAGLTEPLGDVQEAKVNGVIRDLRAARLLLAESPGSPDALDAHPLVRAHFGRLFERERPAAWRAAHGRLYDHLIATDEGEDPTVEALDPLFQAIPHGVRAGWVPEALEDVYKNRLCRRGPDGGLAFHAQLKLGGTGQMLAAVSWFFDPPYTTPHPDLTEADRSWVLNQAAFGLRAAGRLQDALAPMQVGLEKEVAAPDWRNAGIAASNLSETQLLIGQIEAAIASAEAAVAHADRSEDPFEMMVNRTVLAYAHHQRGRRHAALSLFVDAEQRQKDGQPQVPRLYSLRGYQYGDLLLDAGFTAERLNRAEYLVSSADQHLGLLDQGLAYALRARCHLRSAVDGDPAALPHARADADTAVERLREAALAHHTPIGLLARVGVARHVGDWDAATRDLDAVDDIAAPAGMKLFLADAALERARLCCARLFGHAPLAPRSPSRLYSRMLGTLSRAQLRVSGLLGKPLLAPDLAALHTEAVRYVDTAETLITRCAYHRRDDELAELRDVLTGRRAYAGLPVRG